MAPQPANAQRRRTGDGTLGQLPVLLQRSPASKKFADVIDENRPQGILLGRESEEHKVKRKQTEDAPPAAHKAKGAARGAGRDPLLALQIALVLWAALAVASSVALASSGRSRGAWAAAGQALQHLRALWALASAAGQGGASPQGYLAGARREGEGCLSGSEAAVADVWPR
eukprot:CAMPEP_0168409024 /NCGR_PEP_ID=MMETSP0228-20121227/26972_1 /TAXON_ID=133427 /ORGANISM="Protoceratium reticulatum, Strain CCCM 535 (=CCMP 1889)" /LENGTH=170 /DNA_ID=CAMNT_0008422727 /DNA_START=65 /DNA_END=575 /DNA_ORIENTATION=+